MALRHRAAFGLLEVIAAVSVALLLAVGISWVAVAGQRMVAYSATAGTVTRAAASEWEELRTLSFSDGEAGGLVSRLFPHADVGRNSSSAWYSAAPVLGRPASTFFTRVVCGDVRLQIAATFVAFGEDGWRPCDPVVYPDGQVQPPSPYLLVCIAEVSAPAKPVIAAVLPPCPEAAPATRVTEP